MLIREWWFFGVLVLAIAMFLTSDVRADYNPYSYGYVKIFLGKNGGSGWNDAGELGGGVGAGYVQRIGKSAFYLTGRLEHTSQPMSGFPFDGRDESTLDHIGASIEYRF